MATARTTYQDGRAAKDAAPARHKFVWVNLRDPSPEEIASVQHEFGLPDRLVDDIDTPAKGPALEITGELVLATVTTTRWVAAEDAVRLGKVQLVLGDGFVVSVDRDEGALERVRHDGRADTELAAAGPAAVVTCVVDHAIKGYGPVFGALNDAVDEVTEALFPAGRSRPTERIYHLARQVFEFRRATAPLAEMLDRLATESPAPVSERLRRRFRQQRAHLLHLVDGADGLGNLLTNAFQANLAEVSVRQNNDMRRISAWAAIVAVPTLLAGIYGMNFRHMPELHWQFGYPLVLVAMVAICLGLHRAFRHNGWL